MPTTLATTNLLLTILAVVSAVQAFVIVGAAIALYGSYRRVSRLVDRVAPSDVTRAVARVHAILDDVTAVSARVKRDVERFDAAVQATIDTADSLGAGVRSKTTWVFGLARGLRGVVSQILNRRATSV